MIGFLGLVFISTSGAKLICTPNREACSPIRLPIASTSLLSCIAPKVIFHGKGRTESSRIATPHSASIPISNGVLVCF